MSIIEFISDLLNSQVICFVFEELFHELLSDEFQSALLIKLLFLSLTTENLFHTAD